MYYGKYFCSRNTSKTLPRDRYYCNQDAHTVIEYTLPPLKNLKKGLNLLPPDSIIIMPAFYYPLFFITIIITISANFNSNSNYAISTIPCTLR